MSRTRLLKSFVVWSEFDLWATGLDAPQQFVFGELCYDKHFLSARTFARQHLEAASHRYRNA